MSSSHMEAFRAEAPIKNSAPNITLADYERLQLENGLTILLVRHTKLPYVSFRLELDHAPPLEGDQTGLAEITADLISRGTERMDKVALNEQIDYWGARLSVGPRGAVGGVLKRYVQDYWRVFSEVFLSPRLDPAELVKVKTLRLSSLQAAMESPSAIADNVYHRAVFGSDHPYGEVITPAHVERIDAVACAAHHRQYWEPSQAYLLVVGDITLDELKSMALADLEGWQAKELPAPNYATPKTNNQVHLHIHDRRGAVQTELHVGYPMAFHPTSPDRLAVTLMNEVLGGGVFSGYLMQNLREDKGYTYGVRSVVHTDAHCADFRVSTSVGTEVTIPAVREIFHEMNRIKTSEVDPDHLQLSKSALVGRMVRSAERPMQVGMRILHMERNGVDPSYYAHMSANIEEVDQQTIQEAARRYMRPKGADVVLVGDAKAMADEIHALQDELQASISYYDAYGSPVNNDAE